MNGRVENCTNYATITYNREGTASKDVSWAVGGIVGRNRKGTIIKSINYGSVTALYVAGGISGNNQQNAEVNECMNYGNVQVIDNFGEGSIVGGIVAKNGFILKGSVRNCINVGSVTSTVSNSYGGGIVGGIGWYEGQNSHSLIENCYNIGRVSSKKAAGGIFGLKINGGNAAVNEIKNNYWLDTCGPTAGRGGGSNDGATKKTASELKGLANTLGSAFTNDKIPNINNGYPILKWQL